VCGTRAPQPGPDGPAEAGGRRAAPAGFRAFSVSAGGLLCASCRGPGATHPAPPVIALMSALMSGDWPHADAADQRHQVECSGLVAAYLQWHLEHSIRSLQHVEHA
jgi:DNA repair protein RecO (recombination protein O)